MYRMWDEDSDEDRSSLCSSFWSDGEQQEEEIERTGGPDPNTSDEPKNRWSFKPETHDDDDEVSCSDSTAVRLMTSGYRTWRPEEQDGGEHREEQFSRGDLSQTRDEDKERRSLVGFEEFRIRDDLDLNGAPACLVEEEEEKREHEGTPSEELLRDAQKLQLPKNEERLEDDEEEERLEDDEEEEQLEEDEEEEHLQDDEEERLEDDEEEHLEDDEEERLEDEEEEHLEDDEEDERLEDDEEERLEDEEEEHLEDDEEEEHLEDDEEEEHLEDDEEERLEDDEDQEDEEHIEAKERLEDDEEEEEHLQDEEYQEDEEHIEDKEHLEDDDDEEEERLEDEEHLENQLEDIDCLLGEKLFQNNAHQEEEARLEDDERLLSEIGLEEVRLEDVVGLVGCRAPALTKEAESREADKPDECWSHNDVKFDSQLGSCWTPGAPTWAELQVKASCLEERLADFHFPAAADGRDLEAESDDWSPSPHSEETDSVSSSAFESYMRTMTRAQSEGDLRPKPKSFIRPVRSQQTIKKCDPVAKYFQYKQIWEMFKLPGEKDRKALRWEIRERLAHQAPPPKPRRVLEPNSYVVPTEKKRSALRWEVRNRLVNSLQL